MRVLTIGVFGGFLHRGRAECAERVIQIQPAFTAEDLGVTV